MSYQRAYLDKLLAQDFGVTYAAARIAVGRYLAEAYSTSSRGIPWWEVLPGDPYAITEWIAGTPRYWVPRGKRWSVKLEGNWY